MLAKLSDLTRYFYMPSKGITLTVSTATSGDTISTADALRYLQDAEAKVARVLGDIPWDFTRLAADYTADAVEITVDKIDTDNWTPIGYIYFNGTNVQYTAVTTTKFTGLSADYTIPAAPVGTFVISGSGMPGNIGLDLMKNYESELYARLDIICKECAYNIWVTRFPADDLPKPINEWKKEVDRYLASKQSGNAWLHL
jgi:hypothetical protein